MSRTSQLAEILEKGDAMRGRKPSRSLHRPQDDEHWLDLMQRTIIAFTTQNDLLWFFPLFNKKP
jgi:hypothetical protein